MSITTRLHKQRYSPMNFRTPTKEELAENGFINIRFVTNVHNLSKISYILKSPPIKDRYYEGYAQLIKDFYHECSLSAAKSSRRIGVLSQLYNQQLVKKLAYFLHNPQYYAHSFPNYSISWMFNLLMSMRSYIMRQRIERGEMKPCWNKCNPASNGYYKLPKPMGNKAMIAMGEAIFDIIYDDVLLYLKKCEKKCKKLL